jgi:hypothetical protein
MPGKPTNAGYAQTTLASGKGEGFVQPEFLGPSRKAGTCFTLLFACTVLIIYRTGDTVITLINLIS